MSVGPGGGAPDPMARAQAAFGLIAKQALQTNLQRIEQLGRLTSAAKAGSLSEEEGSAAVDVAHQLVGSAGTFGYAEVSQLARRLEGYFVGRRFTEAASADASLWLALMHEGLVKGPSDSDEWA